MAVKTGAIYKTLTFDSLNSGDFGVYITGSAVYNSPERDVEMISVPGRDGSFVLDRGRFQNIEVSYPAGLYGVDPEDFAEAISDFRNAIGSRVGYCRLEDDYNPDEYRLAVFRAGLEVNPANLESGEFTITFDCKPQRFLKSGETPVAVASGDTLTNPTLQPASPLLIADGYGAIDMAGETIEIQNVPIGLIKLSPSEAKVGTSLTIEIDDTNANPGDAITIEDVAPLGRSAWWEAQYRADSGLVSLGSQSFIGQDAANMYLTSSSKSGQFGFHIELRGGAAFTYGTAKEYKATLLANATFRATGNTVTISIPVSLAYDGVRTITATQGPPIVPGTAVGTRATSIYSIYLNSSKSALGAVHIDLDIGEAYKIEGGAPVSVNNAVNLPAKLPTLKPGANTITFDNTIGHMEILPRWWKL